MKIPFKIISMVLAVVFFSFLGSMIIQKTKAQWIGPPGAPAISNLPAPINVSNSNQTKTGGLTIGRDIWLNNGVSQGSRSGIRFFSNSQTSPRYGYFFNDGNSLKYNVQTSNNPSNPQEQTRFQIANSGDISIGDIIPQAKLHVDGDIRANGRIFSQGQQLLTQEQDPQVGTLQNNMWCTSNGAVVNCTTDPPSEVDPAVGSLQGGRWCTSNGTTINCQATPPVLTENDPEVGTLQNNMWCTSNGTEINCTASAPTGLVGDLTEGQWCRASSGRVVCTSDTPVGINVMVVTATGNGATAVCPSGYKVISGGYNMVAGGDVNYVWMKFNRPNLGANGWTAAANWNSGSMTVYAVCART